MQKLSERTAGFTDFAPPEIVERARKVHDVQHLIRLHFAKKNETLNEALNRLEFMRKKMKG
jgi:hypothetical protein